MRFETSLGPRILGILLMVAAGLHGGDVLRIGGTGSGLGTIKLLAADFETSHPGARVEVLPSLGSSGGIKALLHGALDLAVSARPLSREEAEGGARAQDYARTPFVFVVNQRVTIKDLRTQDLERIFRGRTVRWPDGTRIRVVLRPATDTDTLIVSRISEGMARAMNEAQKRQGMILAVTDQEAADAVRTIPGALGGSTLGQVSSEGLSLRVLSFNGTPPTPGNLASGRYPLVKTLSLVTPGTPSPLAREFLAYVHSPRGAGILAAQGHLPLPPPPPLTPRVP